ncbi:alpha/beta-hydrolase [Hyaloscypha variabilis F]|uniref:Alpha/beta-hydrolase n=1 Tax=Hyaloscypha variabilis (strain UAMH 11265 / GT02V1 / F) TaxID=1149755 RepID=A0A2J6QWD9_HYAVF|nr:alpha/beta-hydrolase [Hyaloscypha variabilis F]
MEFLSTIQGTELPEINTPTFLHFIPQLLRNPLIQNPTPQTHQYGPFPSQQLDVYIPPTGMNPAGQHTKPPVFIFYYGGGYMSGRKQMSLLSPGGLTVYSPNLTSLLSSQDIPDLRDDPTIVDRLYHQNIGTFLASHGFVAVIPDYRLVNMDSVYDIDPENDALFPSGAEDVTLSMKWAVNNLSEIADTETVFAMGHSAGANHLATAILLPEFIPSDPELMSKLKKWCTLSATFDYIHSREQRKVAWSRYFGGFERIGERCPSSLARGLGDGEAGKLPELLCLHAKRDHFGAVDPQRRFWDAWVERGGKGRMEVVRGGSHNHMSTVYGVGCGDEEVEWWLVDVLRWCLEQ